jgi:hypothetical protein
MDGALAAFVGAVIGAVVASILSHVSLRGQARQSAAREVYARFLTALGHLDHAATSYAVSVEVWIVDRTDETQLPPTLASPLREAYEALWQHRRTIDALAEELELIAPVELWAYARRVVWGYDGLSWPGSYLDEREAAARDVDAWTKGRGDRFDRRKHLVDVLRDDVRADPVVVWLKRPFRRIQEGWRRARRPSTWFSREDK